MKKRSMNALREAMPEIFSGADEARVTPQANRAALDALIEALESAPPPTAEEAIAMANYLNNSKRGPL